MKPLLLDIIKVGNTLGEGVQWDDTTESLWWTDIQARRLYRYHLPSGRLSKFQTPDRLCSFGFIENTAGLIVAFARGFAFYNPVSGEITQLGCPGELRDGIRFNDGKVDRQGRFWAGTMTENGDPVTRSEGTLYSLDGTFELHQHESGIGISNGLCWSPEASNLYFADSARRTIYRYEFDPGPGTNPQSNSFCENRARRLP